mmetsp:Transcript_2370/g.7095  ORF Transcript_2370/g.7095 Transcript_2370/m.7095 type:complete len:202 (+) Transcript_2370:238-843(+)
MFLEVPDINATVLLTSDGLKATLATSVLYFCSCQGSWPRARPSVHPRRARSSCSRVLRGRALLAAAPRRVQGFERQYICQSGNLMDTPHLRDVQLQALETNNSLCTARSRLARRSTRAISSTSTLTAPRASPTNSRVTAGRTSFSILSLYVFLTRRRSSVFAAPNNLSSRPARLLTALSLRDRLYRLRFFFFANEQRSSCR